MDPLLPGLNLRLEALRRRRNFDAAVYVSSKTQLLNDYVRRSGLSGLVVGVSGGIDSAITLSLAVHASKQPGSCIKRIVGVPLPFLSIKEGTSNQSTATRLGKELIASVGAECIVVDLTDTHVALKNSVDKAVQQTGNSWAAGQLVSYLRTPALYYVTALLAQAGNPAILLGTTNRDEGAFIGYFGKAADAMNDLQLISDLHKSEVYAVARFLKNIPEEIIEAIPTGDVYDGRTDEQLIGVPYDFIEFYSLFLTLAHPSEASLPYESKAEQAQWDAYQSRIEKLHNENKHKYLGGSPAVHLDVYPRAVPRGWKSQNEDWRVLNRPNTLNFVNLFSLSDDLVADFNLATLTQWYKAHDKVERRLLRGFGNAALTLSGVFSSAECDRLTTLLNQQPWQGVGVNGMKLPEPQALSGATISAAEMDGRVALKQDRVYGSFRASFYSTAFADVLWRRISPHLDSIRSFNEYSSTDFDKHLHWRAVGVSPLFRAIKYLPGGYLVPHYDSTYVYSSTTRTLMSVLIYLTDQGETNAYGGRTRFIVDYQRYLPESERVYKDYPTPPQSKDVLLEVRAENGAILVFDHRLLHDSAALLPTAPTNKIVLRTDIIFEQCGMPSSEELYLSRPLGMPEAPSSSSNASDAGRQGLQHSASASESPFPPGLSKHLLTNRLYQKHLRDPFYSTIMSVSGEWDRVLEAGFFDDGSPSAEEVGPSWKPQWEVSPLNWISTPIYKIVRRLETCSIPEDKWLAVLVSTGSFNPVHTGHVDMMEQGKTAIEKNGGFVLGGYLSPSHDLYVGSKLQNEALSARHRVFLCELATQHSDWLMVDGWEALDTHYPVNFSDVIIHLQQYLSAHIKTHKTIHVVYLFGSDHAAFGLTFVKRGKAVCLNRPGSDKCFKRYMELKWFAENPNIIFWQPNTIAISSTEVRRGEKIGLLAPLVQPVYLSYKAQLKEKNKTSKNIQSITYHVREEGSWAYQHWLAKVPTSLHTTIHRVWSTFTKAVCDAIVAAHSKATTPDLRRPVDMNIETLSAQQKRFGQILASSHDRGLMVLSLDPCLPGDASLSVSRAFGIAAGSQMAKLSPRLGCSDFAHQIAILPAGKYVLFDDDSFTGFTLRTVQDMIQQQRSDIEVVELITLKQGILPPNPTVPPSSAPNPLDPVIPTSEIIDMRDFLLGSFEGGLVCELFNSSASVRAPYILPYVSPHARCSIPLSMEVQFSIAIWNANLEFFRALPSDVATIGSSFAAGRSLCLDVGAEPSTSLVEVASRHIQRLSELWEVQHSSSKR